MTDLLVVAGDGLRTAGLAAALSRRFSVRVLEPLADSKRVSRLVGWLSPLPRLGQARSRALLQAIADDRPRAVLFVGSHLAAAAPTLRLPVLVDFPTLAVHGQGLEAVKARWWEPGEARRAVAVSSPSADDVAVLASWGARAVLVPDGSPSAEALVDALEGIL